MQSPIEPDDDPRPTIEDDVRAIRGTALLIVTGAVIGALIGLFFALLPSFLFSLPGQHTTALDLTVPAAMGAGFGAILAPITGWTILRRVPFATAVAGTAAGTIIGTVLGTLVLLPPVGAVVGYLVAAAMLRRRFAPKPESQLDP